MITGTANDYFTLKLIIALMLLALLIIATSLFYRLHREKLLKIRKEGVKSKILSLLDTYLSDNEQEKERSFLEMKSCFVKDKVFREVMIDELRSRIEDGGQIANLRELFKDLGGVKTTTDRLISKDPLTIYKGLLETDIFGIYLPKECLLQLQNHKDIRIRILTGCILFRCNNEIKVEDILNLEPILSPMVEIKIFDELKKRAVSSSQIVPVKGVINECLQSDISEKMRVFLQKSLNMIGS